MKKLVDILVLLSVIGWVYIAIDNTYHLPNLNPKNHYTAVVYDFLAVNWFFIFVVFDVILQIGFIVHAMFNKTLSITQKILWVFAIFIFNSLAFAIYWLQHNNQKLRYPHNKLVVQRG